MTELEKSREKSIHAIIRGDAGTSAHPNSRKTAGFSSSMKLGLSSVKRTIWILDFGNY